MAEFGISMDGRAPVTDIPAQAGAAEEGGASTLWIACHLYLRDPITMAALALERHQAHQDRPDGDEPYSVHPVFIAMAAATLDEMYPAASSLCLGARRAGRSQAAGLGGDQAAGQHRRGGEDLSVAARRRDGATFPGQVFHVVRPASAGQWWRRKGAHRDRGFVARAC